VGPLSYAVITPARNEAHNLRRLAGCLAAQTIRPERWVIVDDGSTDGTDVAARELAREHEWVDAVVLAPDRSTLAAGRRAGRDVRAFNAGLAELDRVPEFVVKLDADVSFAARYFENLLGEFERDERLGIAGGLCYEPEQDRWEPRHVTEGHVRGATRMWRRACLEDVLPLELRLGWDGVDELKARARGWRTRTLGHLAFYHHRPVAARDGSRWRKWALDDGATTHYLGYRFSYVVLRALHHARREPAALAMVWGYLAAAIRREPQCDDPGARAVVRRDQRARNLPLRALEALGRRAV
jgi:glycosyltransferase involved in cell wall biosynthesis